VATSANGEVRAWTRDERSSGETLIRHRDAVRACALSPDGQLLAVGGDDGLLRLLNLGSGHELGLLPMQGRPTVAALLPDPLVLYGDDGGGVCLARLDQFGKIHRE
jgi:WD40 repeat protein